CINDEECLWRIIHFAISSFAINDNPSAVAEWLIMETNLAVGAEDEILAIGASIIAGTLAVFRSCDVPPIYLVPALGYDTISQPQPSQIRFDGFFQFRGLGELLIQFSHKACHLFLERFAAFFDFFSAD